MNGSLRIVVAELSLQNIFKLHRDLKNRVYKHGPYTDFYIHDPKQRHIHKATVRDRVLHHAIFNILNPIFEPTFIATSFSCRIGKGNHKGTNKLADALRKMSKNGSKICFALKCDIKKFFENVNKEVLLKIIGRKVKDDGAMRLTEEIVESFPASLPIGNLTSQLFANVYLNEFDQFVKNELKIKHYLRISEYKNDLIDRQTFEQSLQSYLGVLSQANTYKLSRGLKNQFWFWLNE